MEYLIQGINTGNEICPMSAGSDCGCNSDNTFSCTCYNGNYDSCSCRGTKTCTTNTGCSTLSVCGSGQIGMSPVSGSVIGA